MGFRGFQVEGLGAEAFAGLFGMGEGALRERRARLEVVTRAPGFPCRVSLEDAAVGEEVVLVHYTHQRAETPFHASHAVYVRRGAARARLAVGEVPLMLRRRLLSVRAFDGAGMMVAAEVTEGVGLEALVEAMLENRAVDELQVHTAKQGCYLARVVRAG